MLYPSLSLSLFRSTNTHTHTHMTVCDDGEYACKSAGESLDKYMDIYLRVCVHTQTCLNHHHHSYTEGIKNGDRNVANNSKIYR